MKILHLSDTTLSGSPIRIVDLLNKYTDHKARHIVWNPVVQYRTFKLDLEAAKMGAEAVTAMLEWADVIHFHNRHIRQELFKTMKVELPAGKKSVIQIHSPRESEDFSGEIESGVPIAVVAQYHVRQWPEASYVVPNVVDIEAAEYKREMPPLRQMPVVSFAPSNWNAKGWDDKGYNVVAPVLKRLALSHTIHSQIITSQPHDKVMEMKRSGDIGIDEIVTGSYHLSALEYLALGIPCFANIDEQTYKVMVKLTGADRTPFLKANRDDFQMKLEQIISDRSWQDLGLQSRAWMEQYWNPAFLAKQYVTMYEDL